jgi:pimeloyl-ACP methyl ester carboxylesterase
LAWAVWKLFIQEPAYPWHQGPHWQTFLQCYDRRATEQYSACSPRLVTTHFGSTQTYACGNPSHPPVVFLHGAGSSSLIWGDWIVPQIQSQFYSIFIDYVCDAGRSSPRDNDTKNCPQTADDLAQWLKEILTELHLSSPVSLVGYSYGSFIASQFTLLHSSSVNKLVLIAPAAVVAPIESAWLIRMLANMVYPGPWFFRYMSNDPESFDKIPVGELAELTSAQNVRATYLNAPPVAFSDNQLRELASQHPSLLIIGDKEKVINHTIAIETAHRAGFQVCFFVSFFSSSFLCFVSQFSSFPFPPSSLLFSSSTDSTLGQHRSYDAGRTTSPFCCQYGFGISFCQSQLIPSFSLSFYSPSR